MGITGALSGEVQHVLLPASAPMQLMVSLQDVGLGKAGQGCAAVLVAAYIAVPGA